jgi:hypothetical protein
MILLKRIFKYYILRLWSVFFWQRLGRGGCRLKHSYVLACSIQWVFFLNWLNQYLRVYQKTVLYGANYFPFLLQMFVFSHMLHGVKKGFIWRPRPPVSVSVCLSVCLSVYVHTIQYQWLKWVEFSWNSARSSCKILLVEREFLNNRPSNCHTLLIGVKDFLDILSAFLDRSECHLVQKISAFYSWGTVNIKEVGLVKAIIHSRTHMECTSLSEFFNLIGLKFVKICAHKTLPSEFEFRENLWGENLGASMEFVSSFHIYCPIWPFWVRIPESLPTKVVNCVVLCIVLV